MPQSLASLFIHGVFSTKLREPSLASPAFRSEMHAFLGGASARLDCPPLVVGGVEDHVHMLVQLSRTIAVADWVKEVKRVSSIHAKTRHPGFGWQSGYGVFSVDQSSLDRVAAYIRNQEEHHRKISFQDEFRDLMREHGIEWDERYVWE